MRRRMHLFVLVRQESLSRKTFVVFHSGSTWECSTGHSRRRRGGASTRKPD